MLIKKSTSIKENDVTDESLFRNRRKIIQAGMALGTAGVAPALWSQNALAAPMRFENLVKTDYTVEDEITPYESIISYNNFYEFSTDKRSPKDLAKDLKTRPWTVEISGECNNPGTFGIEDLLADFPQEERIYRFRCVEAWSMIVPWVGFPLASLLKKADPTGNAKYVEFLTLVDEKQMPGQKRGVFGYVLDWPYREGLRIDEAMNPLALLATGVYGQHMPNQNGAPIRLIVPWKYGFKSIKSIVSINLTEKQPFNTWQQQNANEYGFYANVNPEVSHPRWTQARERRLGEWTKRPTLPFNGYSEEVAGLYSGMDLTRDI
ncbi:MAG: sulfoxide reductase catalytic subunit YedY [Parasphingorhabdus sp.]|jgi:sulfoxide reductase catalytic subunit YedY